MILSAPHETGQHEWKRQSFNSLHVLCKSSLMYRVFFACWIYRLTTVTSSQHVGKRYSENLGEHILPFNSVLSTLLPPAESFPESHMNIYTCDRVLTFTFPAYFSKKGDSHHKHLCTRCTQGLQEMWKHSFSILSPNLKLLYLQISFKPCKAASFWVSCLEPRR